MTMNVRDATFIQTKALPAAGAFLIIVARRMNPPGVPWAAPGSLTAQRSMKCPPPGARERRISVVRSESL